MLFSVNLYCLWCERLSRAYYGHTAKWHSRYFIAKNGASRRSRNQATAMETHESNIHIGQLIKDQLKHDQRSASWLAREIGCTRNHVYKVFRKPSLDTDLLLCISKAMHFNFFQYYTAALYESMQARLGEEE